MSPETNRNGEAPSMGTQLAETRDEQQFEAAVQRTDGGETTALQLFDSTPAKAMEQMRQLVTMMKSLINECGRDRFVADIEGSPYPKQEWWTSVGMPLQLMSTIKDLQRLDLKEGYDYQGETWQARASVIHIPTGNVITEAFGLCSADETWPGGKRRWHDSYAIQSMAQTRAIGRCYRGPLAGLAVMAGLKPTPAEEMYDGLGKSSGKTPKPPPKEGGEGILNCYTESNPDKQGFLVGTKVKFDIGALGIGDEQQFEGIISAMQPRAGWTYTGPTKKGEPTQDGPYRKGVRFEQIVDRQTGEVFDPAAHPEAVTIEQRDGYTIRKVDIEHVRPIMEPEPPDAEDFDDALEGDAELTAEAFFTEAVDTYGEEVVDKHCHPIASAWYRDKKGGPRDVYKGDEKPQRVKAYVSACKTALKAALED